MQAAGERIRAAALLVEFAACVQARENQLDDRRVLFRVQADRNTASVVLDRNAAVAVQRDLNLLAVTGQRFVGRVVDDLLHDVQGFSVRVYIPGRWRTGSSPFRTRIDASV